METIIKKVSVNPIIPEQYREAADILKSGGLVAFPTETVYGLGGDGLLSSASKKIYGAKGRPSDNPLIIHIADIKSLEILSENVPKEAYILAEKFWPGPLTMILPKGKRVPYETTGGLDTVAVRMPDHPAALALIRQSGVCIAAPSANTSGRPSPTSAEHVKEDLYGKIDMILDGGETEIGIESTIVDLTVSPPLILRPGYISKEMLEEAIGGVSYDPAILKNADASAGHAPSIPENADASMSHAPSIPKSADSSIGHAPAGLEMPAGSGKRPRAPGMKYRHYAPKGELTIYEGELENVVNYINRQAETQAGAGKKVGIIATEQTRDFYKTGIVKTVGSREDELSISRGLYRVLREFDKENVQVIFGESLEGGRMGQAVMNRMLKAAGHRIVKV